jgi:NAD(P)-dependent dehydrogenase (short-subunit alcohol dehydrogenase family)
VTWEVDLGGSTALVTGASRGIGRAVALGLARAGCDLIGLARGKQPLDELGGEVAAIGRRYLALPADLAEAGDLEAVAAQAWSWSGGVDVLVNVAGIIVRTDPPGVSPEDWDRTFAVNVRGPFFLTQAIGARMLAAGGGSIVNLASVAGEHVTKASLSYQASKAALLQLTRGLAVRWAPSVRVNAVGPGYVRTDLNSAWLDQPANRDYVLGNTPLGRVGEPADVVGAVTFLASPAAAYVTGQHLRIDGGWSAR